MAELLPFAKPNEDCITKARELLESCEKGEVIALAYAAVLSTDAGVQTSFVTGNANVFTLFGAIERLKLRFHYRIMED